MNIKEIGEIRRHTRRDRSNMTALYGCFVNDNKEVISYFRQSFGTMPENEAEQFFSHLKRTLHGTVEKNLIDLSFNIAQVSDGLEHKLLMNLRETELEDETLLHEFFQKIVDSVTMESCYLILIGCDSYDVPFKSKVSKDDESYRYLLCSICPVKLSKPSIEYKAPEQEFHNSEIAQLLTPPSMGFLFPAFDNRSTNIYGALFYTKDATLAHEDFIAAVFATTPVLPAEEQKKAFDAILTNSLRQECVLPVVQAIQEEMETKILLHKETNSTDPLTMDKTEITSVLTASGVSEKAITSFGAAYDEAYGADGEILPRNLISPVNVEVKSPGVVIKVKRECRNLVEARIVDGQKYVMVRVDDEVEFDGIPIAFGET